MIKRDIYITLGVLIVTIIFFGISDIDKIIQNNFYNFDTHLWILDSAEEPYRFIFYDGIKKLLILFAVFLVFTMVVFRKSSIVKEYRSGILIVILACIFIPSSVGALKKYTNMPCPKAEKIYGGLYPETKVWETYIEESYKKDTSKCWPAGHASGGFALLSLFFLFKSRKNKILALIVACTIGWSMGIYKMLIGDHFFSHTVITMILAWLIILILVFFIRNRSKNNG
ncbi:MAG: phosphatase PAP2 family protein [Arcobacteraceae bacterium]